MQLIISIHAPRTGSDVRPCANGDVLGRYFNPRSPHGERQVSMLPVVRRRNISIHAPRTGSDCKPVSAELCVLYFNPRSPHGERRPQVPPVAPARYFNPRSPHGERPCQRFQPVQPVQFQSTLPARGATSCVMLTVLPTGISIHAPRTGSDVLIRSALVAPS